MYYSRGLEYIVGAYSADYSLRISYFSKFDDNYSLRRTAPLAIEPHYTKTRSHRSQYKNQEYSAYNLEHSFMPQLFLSPSRPRARFVDDEIEIKHFVEEAFEAMMKENIPEDISITILCLEDFRTLHSSFGVWSEGILGFSINGIKKEIFVRENNLDELMIVIGHEIGHVLSDSLPNKHDEEAKAFAFSIEWAKIIKHHNIANLGLSIKDELDFKPARNGLHDVAFAFVDLMVKKGRKAMELHQDLVRKYTSIFNIIYPK